MKQKNHINLKEDMHVHSTYSDGKDTVYENVQQAQHVGLERICCVDHVRRSTDWVGDFVQEVQYLNQREKVEIYSGLETKILDENGTLDVPPNYAQADFLFVADHQFPLYGACYTPSQIKGLLQNEHFTKHQLVEKYISAMIHAVNRYENVVVAHLFSIFPKVGMDESLVDKKSIKKLAMACKKNGACIEIDERWKCPNARTLEVFIRSGVRVLSSSDSHMKKNIGQYEYNQKVNEELHEKDL